MDLPVATVEARTLTGIIIAIPVITSAPIGFMMAADGTPNTRSEEAVVPGNMTGNATNYSAAHAAGCVCWNRRQADGGQHRGC